MKLTKPEYLGDGVYVQPDPNNAGGIILTTESHRLQESLNCIFLDSETLSKLIPLIQPE